MNRVLTVVFASLILAIQFPLWLGKGGWLKVWEMDRQVVAQARANEDLRRRNGALEAEVRELKQGLEAVEERARFELGMIKDDEVFFQVLDAPAAPAQAR
jgi:cell division protein FtsB